MSPDKQNEFVNELENNEIKNEEIDNEECAEEVVMLRVRTGVRAGPADSGC